MRSRAEGVSGALTLSWRGSLYTQLDLCKRMWNILSLQLHALTLHYAMLLWVSGTHLHNFVKKKKQKKRKRKKTCQHQHCRYTEKLVVG